MDNGQISRPWPAPMLAAAGLVGAVWSDEFVRPGSSTQGMRRRRSMLLSEEACVMTIGPMFTSPGFTRDQKVTYFDCTEDAIIDRVALRRGITS